MTPDHPSGLVDAAMIEDVRQNVSAGAADSLYADFFAEVRNHGLRKPDRDPTDLQPLADRAHSLISNCGTFGLVALATIAREIEICCSEGNHRRAAELAVEFDGLAEPSILQARSVLTAD